MGHAAYMRDGDLLPRAASGDAEALLVLAERYGARLHAIADEVTGESGPATEVVAEVFARLAAGQLPVVPGSGPDVLSGVAAEVARGFAGRAAEQPRRRVLRVGRAAPPVLTQEVLVQRLLARVPAPQREALEAALWQRALDLASPEEPTEGEAVETPPLPAVGALGPTEMTAALLAGLPAERVAQATLPQRREGRGH